MKILVAGGAGYIGLHSCVVLLQQGHDVVIVDSLVSSHPRGLEQLRRICGRPVEFVEADLRDRRALDRIFADYRVDAVVNFAGYKAAGDSVSKPFDYYDNNLNCALALLECMLRHRVTLQVFSSSAAVYGEPESLPVAERARTLPTSPYGRTKLMIEDLLTDVAAAERDWKIAILRYFNPVGAHPGGLIGELPRDEPGNLMPVLCRVAAGECGPLQIYGNDYATPDGTAIRDYIHIMDLAAGHVSAIEKLASMEAGAVLTVNLGTGKGYSVLELLHAFEQACGRKLDYRFAPRRPGDMACCYADPGLALELLGWRARLGLDDMCADAWNWQQRLSASN